MADLRQVIKIQFEHIHSYHLLSRRGAAVYSRANLQTIVRVWGNELLQMELYTEFCPHGTGGQISEKK